MRNKFSRINYIQTTSHAGVNQPTPTPVGRNLSKSPNLVSVYRRFFPTSVVSSNALQVFYKRLLSGNSFLGVPVGYITLGTGYTPIRLIQLSQCSDTYVHTCPYVRVISAFPSLWLGVDNASLQVRSAEPPQRIHKSNSWLLCSPLKHRNATLADMPFQQTLRTHLMSSCSLVTLSYFSSLLYNSFRDT